MACPPLLFLLAEQQPLFATCAVAAVGDRVEADLLAYRDTGVFDVEMMSVRTIDRRYQKHVDQSLKLELLVSKTEKD